MALLCLNYLSKEDIDIWNKKSPDRRTAKGKFISHLLDEQGLLRDGYRMREIAFELKKLLKNYAVENISIPNSIYVAKEYIEAGFPVILSVGNESFCHAILAIGTEYEGEVNNERLLKLFCLDPAYGITKSAYWNCVIDTSRNNHGDYPFTYITEGDVCRVKINELITIDRNEYV